MHEYECMHFQYLRSQFGPVVMKMCLSVNEHVDGKTIATQYVLCTELCHSWQLVLTSILHPM